MPWVKDFDEELVVERALGVFWTNGYEATSMQDLAAAMQINKSSLYNAFGSKKELFTRSLAKYDREIRRALLNELEARDSPLEAIFLLFDRVLAESRSDPDQKGCFLINTACELRLHSSETQAFVTSGILDIELFFQGLIDRAKAKGEISPLIDSGQTAKCLLSQFVGLRVLGRGALKVADFQASRMMVKKQLALPL